MKPRQEEQCLIFGGVNFFPCHAQFVPFAWPDFRISNLSQFFSFWRLIFFLLHGTILGSLVVLDFFPHGACFVRRFVREREARRRQPKRRGSGGDDNSRDTVLMLLVNEYDRKQRYRGHSRPSKEPNS